MPADKPIRRGQLIAPFGVGSMVDFPGDVALMTAGLDAWPMADQHCPPEWRITEERLQQRLGVTHFRTPPEFLDSQPGARHVGLSVPFVRFPQYQYCPKCGCMRLVNIFSGRVKCDGKEKECAEVSDRRRRFLIPVRIVAVCGHGHIQDFPFHEWVHGNSTTSSDVHRLRYSAGGTSASLSGIVIQCSCGKSRSLAGAFNYSDERGGALKQELRMGCAGARPWLGEMRSEGATCSQDLRVVQRGASNVYFPVTYSSIYLPLWAEAVDARIIKILENPRAWSALTTGLLNGKLIDPTRCAVLAEDRDVDADKLLRAAQKKLDGLAETTPSGEEEYRRHEYEAFRAGRGGEPSDLKVDRRNASSYAGPFGSLIREVGLIRRLRETRVLAGFSRLLPAAAGGDAERIQPLSRGLAGRWLPAMVVRGEGIFIDFDPKQLDSWASKSGVDKHLEFMIANYRIRARERRMEERVISPKFVLLHSFAHILVRQLANDCGYGSASLRERIYCDLTAGADQMQGVLIYTASGDSEGTMGGLVRQGEPGRLEHTVNRALHEARWCSADPICLESSGQGSDSGNLAACHGCALLPETSCEEGNRLLDRQTLIGRPNNAHLGFFNNSQY